MLAGYSEAEILGLGDISQLQAEQIRDLLHSKKIEAMKATGEALTKAGVKVEPAHKRTKRKTTKRKSRKHRNTKK